HHAEQRDVVGLALFLEHGREQLVGELLGVTGLRLDGRSRQPPQPGVERLAASFDQSVRVQQQRRTGGKLRRRLDPLELEVRYPERYRAAVLEVPGGAAELHHERRTVPGAAVAERT